MDEFEICPGFSNWQRQHSGPGLVEVFAERGEITEESFDWGTPAPGEHQITSRAFDVDGNIQPAPDDPYLASRRTFWESNGHITRRVLIP